VRARPASARAGVRRACACRARTALGGSPKSRHRPRVTLWAQSELGPPCSPSESPTWQGAGRPRSAMAATRSRACPPLALQDRPPIRAGTVPRKLRRRRRRRRVPLGREMTRTDSEQRTGAHWQLELEGRASRGTSAHLPNQQQQRTGNDILLEQALQLCCGSRIFLLPTAGLLLTGHGSAGRAPRRGATAALQPLSIRHGHGGTDHGSRAWTRRGAGPPSPCSLRTLVASRPGPAGHRARKPSH
jgi:hypothetical protein